MHAAAAVCEHCPGVLAGKAVCERVMSAKLCSGSSLGVYLTCEKLREVDAMPVVDHYLSLGEWESLHQPSRQMLAEQEPCFCYFTHSYDWLLIISRLSCQHVLTLVCSS